MLHRFQRCFPMHSVSGMRRSTFGTQIIITIDRYVVASIRPHINNGQPAMQCLTWLLNTYPEVYTAQDIQWVINRNDGESQRYPARQQGYSQINAVLNEALG